MSYRLRCGLLAALWLASAGAFASDSLRVGNRVLVVGDSAATVTALLGKPTQKSRRKGESRRGRRVRVIDNNTRPAERWQYRRDGRQIVVTLIDGRVVDIDERRR